MRYETVKLLPESRNMTEDQYIREIEHLEEEIKELKQQLAAVLNMLDCTEIEAFRQTLRRIIEQRNEAEKQLAAMTSDRDKMNAWYCEQRDERLKVQHQLAAQQAACEKLREALLQLESEPHSPWSCTSRSIVEDALKATPTTALDEVLRPWRDIVGRFINVLDGFPTLKDQARALLEDQ